MKEDNEWKVKYQTTVKELDEKEDEWLALEEILRKAIARLSIAGRGIDKSLDQQLKDIQLLSRQKQDQDLLQALDQLADIVAALDDDNPSQIMADDLFEPSSILLEMLQRIPLEAAKTKMLKTICADLLKAIASGANQQSIEPLVEQLSSLINEGFLASELTLDNTTSDILFQLVSMLKLNDSDQQQVRQQFDFKTELTQQELQHLADIINARFSNDASMSAAAPGITIDSAISTLLEQLATVQGESTETGEILARIESGINPEDWPDTLNDIVNSVSLTLEKLSNDKSQLENFILAITEQLSEITGVISEDMVDHISERRDTQSLQVLVQEGMAAIKSNVNTTQDISQLKTIIGSNIDSIRDGVESFALRVNARHDATEIRNKKLTDKISLMEQETEQLQQKLAENRKRLLYDTLTGVHSRLAYEELIQQEFSRWKRHGSTFSYVILDIDHFKKVNDEYGHNAGDKALRLIAQSMQKQIRKSDTLFRIGGEEFVLLLTNTSAAQAEPLLTKLRKNIAEISFHFKQKRVAITLSAGITESKSDDTVQSLYERADAALYRAKDAGRDCQITT